ncbi:M13 family metallopeptidase [Hymenobacter busanensis]|uniref:M13 family metallopeptidase n=1 Tax=Hymenobacter busanensis TaxID=2607656 RepID=A0A7L4ZW91_9BACT|nr:M13 family metallopeptidase [Hymenobacter busanensis]KAA9332400.1 M13 family metallopeptidase [Hymenobacter busanensis]QHJ07263.1 M13 family peptidase [Hymenobacter busanensis]
MKNRNRVTLVVAAWASLAVWGCSSSKTTVPTAKSPAASAAPAATATTAAPAAETFPQGTGLNVSNIDKSVQPCQDFNQYASGNWLKNNPIPASEVRWGSFNELADKNNAVMRQILQEAAANQSAAKGTNAQKVGDYYATAMDTMAIEKAGIAPLKPELDRINAIKSLDALQMSIARSLELQTGAFFNTYVGQDDKISTQYAVNMSQGGLSLPDRDYYLKDDARSKSIRAAFQNYLVNTFKLAGDNEAAAKKNAATIVRLETRLAKASKSRVDLRDPYANYNKMTVAQLQQKYPNLNPKHILDHTGLKAAKEVIVGQPAFFQELNTMLKAEPLADLKTYLRWHLVTSMTSALPQAFNDESFKFTQVLTGAKKQQPRWKRMNRATDGALGEAFGQLYVDKAFTPEAKAKAMQMVQNIKEAMGEHIQQSDWMSDATKKEAMKKLNAFTVKIGYPDQWKDYSTLNISRDSYLQNVIATRLWQSKDNTSKLGKPIDRKEWGMTPPTVNAYYNPSMNEIVFPAGIMQPPFFDPKADDAVNYGGMGAVIGHEITHGFDDQGRQYDAEGNLKDWWTKEDAAKFEARAAVVGKQYDAFSPVDSVFVNGKLTMGENLADLGGLNIAYTALHKQLQKQYPNGNYPKYDGLTPDQRFFLSWAQVWRTNARPEFLRQQVMTDPHSPAQFRTNGPLMNMPQFYEAFGCKEDAKMMRAQTERAKIW